MKKGKRVLSIIIVGVFLIVCISLVNAGLKDWFGFGEDSDLEGELPDSFNIGIQMTNQAPNITNWTIPTGFTPTACTTTTLASFIVYVKDPDGDIDLSDGVVTAYFYRGAIKRPATPVTCSAGTPNGDNVLEFTCPSITMNYWDIGGIGNKWSVNVSATDGTAKSINTANAGYQLSNDNIYYPNLTYGSSKIVQVKDNGDADYTSGGAGTDTISWTGIVTSSFDAASSDFLICRNCGNEVVASTSLTGKKLDCTACAPATDICPNSFSVRAAAVPCNTGTPLVWPAASVVIGGSSGIAVSSGADSTTPFYFCLEDINNPTFPADTCEDPITVGTYDSTGNTWDITF